MRINLRFQILICATCVSQICGEEWILAGALVARKIGSKVMSTQKIEGRAKLYFPDGKIL